MLIENRASGLSISLQLVQDVVVARSHPVAGIDYPRTLQEFNEWFPSEKACQAYLRQLRWRAVRTPPVTYDGIVGGGE